MGVNMRKDGTGDCIRAALIRTSIGTEGRGGIEAANAK